MRSRIEEGERGRSGSVLLLTLLVVSLLLVLVLGFTVFVRVQLREVSNNQQRAEAQANARLGMDLALAQLQKTAGPDMRVTATASLLDQNPDTSAVDGQVNPYWTGVWKKQDLESRSHDPVFEGWLTSLRLDKSEQESSSEASVDATFGITLVGEGSVLTPSEVVKAEKVDIPISGDVSGRYAYLVLDQGVKASLALQDPDHGKSTLTGYASQLLAQRQAAETLPGFSALGSTESVLIESAHLIDRLPTWRSVGLVDLDFAEGSREEFHHATLMTMGVLSDTARGGLKTDLTLAFEKSDAEFHTLSAFSDSGEENQSGSWNQGFDLGYVYALEGRSGNTTSPASERNPEAADWSSSNLKVRGPTWDVLRNYYLMYQDRAALGANEGLPARAARPDRFDGVSRNESPVLSYNSTKEADVRNLDNFSGLYVFGNLNQSGNVMRVTEPALAPVVTRVMYVFSLAREGGNLALVMNNIVVLHNPYNVPIEFRGFKFSPIDFPIESLKIRRRPDPADLAPALGDLDKEIDDINDWIRVLTGASKPWTYVNYIFTEDGSSSPSDRMVMEPGEIIAFSNTDDPLLYGTETVDQVGLASGPEYEEDSGLYFNRFGTSSAGIGGNKVEAITLDDTSRVWIEMELKSTWGNYLFLTPDTLNASSDSWDRSHQSDALIGRLDTPIGTLSGGGRTIGSLTGDYYTGLELGASLADRVPLFVMDARLKPLTDDAAVLSTYNPRAMISQNRFMDGDLANWEARLYEITSFNEIDLDLDIGSGRNNAYWGPSVTGTGETMLPLFEVPQGPMMSVAGFAQVEVGQFVHDPPYAVGNSFAHPLVDRDAVYNYLGAGNSGFSVVDQSYLTNEALWDGYFFSTLLARSDLGWSLDRTATAFRDGEEPLLNRNFVYEPMAGVSTNQVEQDMLDPERVAAHLLQEGVFNINSTSVSAWVSVLSGLRKREIKMADGSTQNVSGTFYSRMEYPVEGHSDLYKGFVELSDAQIEDLATELVKEVKMRGPFLSLADFVNRRLENDDTGLSGPLQAAIERAGLNNRFPNASPANGSLLHPEHQVSQSVAGSPGYLLQSDVLRVIGSRLTPRSDTFLVRAYGESLSGSSTEPSAAVWCEALVQRVPEPVDSLSPISNGVNSGNYEPETPENFGRRFEILSFRYLDPDEI
ncbi:hypothetical protein P3T73_00585 [Kiritimatiellota bacterium B12222]|nr:hypothetical protein P3T73_00585 [Kiritimatiellota bacterium B12222]